MGRVLAILTSDWHLRPTVPRARSLEPDWYIVMDRMLDQVIDLQITHDCPILCAGDIFHQWYYQPEIVNWVIEKFGGCLIYAIPGQHDLPYHDYEKVHKSAYYTLCCAGIIDGGRDDVHFDDFVIHRRPWEEKLFPVQIDPDKINVLLAHHYVWQEGEGYPGAEKNYTDMEEIKCYDVVVFGDNHKGFTESCVNTTIYNCGCLIPSRMDEKEYTPAVGLLMDDGTVERRYLDISKDLWIEEEDEIEDRSEDVVHLLETIETDGIDFETVFRRAIEKTEKPSVKKILLECLEGKVKDE